MITSATEQRDSPPWNRCARDWAEIQEPRMGPLYQVVLKALSLAPDSRLLDVGCGWDRNDMQQLIEQREPFIVREIQYLIINLFS